MSQVINGVGTRAVCLPCYPLGISLRPTTLLSTVTQAPVKHISLSSPSYSYHYVEAPDIYQIYDKLPEKGGLKELFEQRFPNALVFMKHWVSYPGFFSMQSPQLRQPVEGHTQESKCWNGAKTGEMGGKEGGLHFDNFLSLCVLFSHSYSFSLHWGGIYHLHA